MGGVIILNPLRGPMSQGIDFYAPAGGLDQGQVGAGTTLESLAAVDPGIESIQRAGQGLDLAQVAAGIGVTAPEVTAGVTRRQRLGVGRYDPHIR